MNLLRQVEDLLAGTTTSVALVTAALDAAAAADDRLHAFVRLRRGAALAEAAVADAARSGGDDRPLLGVPFAVKDSHALAGEPAPANGTDVAERDAATVSDPWVASLLAAGAIAIGQTTMPPLALLPWGPARNPQHTFDGPGAHAVNLVRWWCGSARASARCRRSCCPCRGRP